MVEYNCVVQEKHLSEAIRPELVAGLKRVTAQILSVSDDTVSVRFTQIPHGAGYRGGKLSTTSLVRGTIPPGCEQPVRENLLRSICSMWAGIAGCDEDELVVSAVDSDYVSKVY
jgi:phenylpyruvate tautomerase PptA (4-oxalocrotonate tautomerase family)